MIVTPAINREKFFKDLYGVSYVLILGWMVIDVRTKHLVQLLKKKVLVTYLPLSQSFQPAVDRSCRRKEKADISIIVLYGQLLSLREVSSN